MELKTYKIGEVAAMLGMSVTWAYQRAPQWPHLRMGTEYRFTEAHIAEIVELLTVRPEQPSTPEPRRIGTRAQRARRQ